MQEGEIVVRETPEEMFARGQRLKKELIIRANTGKKVGGAYLISTNILLFDFNLILVSLTFYFGFTNILFLAKIWNKPRFS